MSSSICINTPYEEFLARFKEGIHQLFHVEANINELSLSRGLPDTIWKGILDLKPLSVAIPTEYGGRGVKVKECLGVLSAAAYESLALSLTCGINLALFLEPLAKYGSEITKASVFKKFIEKNAMGGLMITEPDHGSDALNMQTAYTEEEKQYKIKGKKHWQGLTGMADFWIVAARKKGNDAQLSRDVEFFVTDNSKKDQKITVDEYYNNLGLYMIPYGLNNLDVKVPKDQKLIHKNAGIKVMLDILHRSRLQFPGIGIGFIKRMLDETLARTRSRIVGGKALYKLDSVRYQISKIQAAYTMASAMCVESVATSGIAHNLTNVGIQANSMKALLTDLMHEAAQICVQLSGASGFRLDHIGGRGIVDSRAFIIFEGPNEMLYSQVSQAFIKKMSKKKLTNFFACLQEFKHTHRVADRFKKVLNFDFPSSISQRQHVTLGEIISRVIAFQYIDKVQEKGFRSDLCDNAFKHIMMNVRKLATNIAPYNNAEPIAEYQDGSDWSKFL